MDSEALRYRLQPEVIERMNAVFEAFPQVAQVILYGSRANGDFKRGSDIDLAWSATACSCPRC